MISLQRLGDTVTAARVTGAWAKQPNVQDVTLVHWDSTAAAAHLLPGVSKTLPLPYASLRRGRRVHPLASFALLREHLASVEPFDAVINTSSTPFACYLAPSLLATGGDLYGPWMDGRRSYTGNHPCLAYLNEWGTNRELNVFSHQDLYATAAGVDLRTPGRLEIPETVDREVASFLDAVAGDSAPLVVHIHSSDPAKDWRPPFEPDGWEALIVALQNELRYSVFMVGGPRDAATIERLAERTGATPALWPLDRTAALLRRSAGLISVDTVSIHLAARVGCPTVVLRKGPAGGLAFVPGPQALLVDPRADIPDASDVIALARAFFERAPLMHAQALALTEKLRVRESYRDAGGFLGTRTPPWLPSAPSDVAQDLSDARWRQAWEASWSGGAAPSTIYRFVRQPDNPHDDLRFREVIGASHRLGQWLRDASVQEVA